MIQILFRKKRQTCYMEEQMGEGQQPLLLLRRRSGKSSGETWLAETYQYQESVPGLDLFRSERKQLH